jgi:hypothetical protein
LSHRRERAPGSVSDVYADDVAATAALFNVLPVDRVAELGREFVEKVLGRVAVVRVGDEVDVVPLGRVLDGLDGLSDDEATVVGVFGLLEVRGPRVVVDVVRHRFGVVVVIVVVGSTRHRMCRYVPSG